MTLPNYLVIIFDQTFHGGDTSSIIREVKLHVIPMCRLICFIFRGSKEFLLCVIPTKNPKHLCRGLM
jgi:hypothetical protein